ncbi:metallophosphoesterase [Sphingobacterium sp. HJSM2_6]
MKLALLVYGMSLLAYSCKPTQSSSTIASLMHNTVNGLYASGEWKKFDSLNQNDILTYFSKQDQQVLAEKYWEFEINEDAMLYIARDKNQQEIPFWLIRNGFQKTDLSLANESVEYEVWKKRFSKGLVQLGINGFDRHRFVYFTLVQPEKQQDHFKISPRYPIQQSVTKLSKGVSTYQDWTELQLQEIPEALQGSYLLDTYRGRSREAHLQKAFRTTHFPSSPMADQILLTWTGDPSTSQHISWRSATSVKQSKLRYWKENEKDTLSVDALVERLVDIQLANDSEINRFHVDLTGLSAGTKYAYQIVTDQQKSISYSFQTSSHVDSMEFGWFGDIHNDDIWAKYVPKWKNSFPNAQFYLLTGDLVNTGQYRDHWDQLMNGLSTIGASRPIMAVPGNHDSQEGIFPSMYQHFLKYPNHGPFVEANGLTYSFVYGHSKFLMLDGVTFSTASQKKWLEEELKASKEKFKIVCFHFAPYTFESTYADILSDWIPLFDQYGVDLVLSGHFHYYLRTQGEKSKSSPMYVMSVATSVKSRDDIQVLKDAHWKNQGYLYQHIKINKNKLELWSVDTAGVQVDYVKIIKPN